MVITLNRRFVFVYICCTKCVYAMYTQSKNSRVLNHSILSLNSSKSGCQVLTYNPFVSFLRLICFFLSLLAGAAFLFVHSCTYKRRASDLAGFPYTKQYIHICALHTERETRRETHMHTHVYQKFMSTNQPIHVQMGPRLEDSLT